MENDPKTPSRDDEPLPTNDEQPSLDDAPEDTDASAHNKSAGAKTVVFPGLKSGQPKPTDDSFGRPDTSLFPESGGTAYTNGAQLPDDALPIEQGTGWDSGTSISKPTSLRARIGMEGTESAELPDEDEPFDAMRTASPPRHEANVTPFPGTHRFSEPAPAELLRGGSAPADDFEEGAGEASDDPAGDAPGNQDALADAVQSALRNIYGSYAEPPDDGVDQGYMVADALAGPDPAGEGLAWSENRAQAADWRAAQARNYDAGLGGPEEGDYGFSQRRQEPAAQDMSLNDYAAHTLGNRWQPASGTDETQRAILRSRGGDFPPESSIIRGHSPEEAARPLEPQWDQTPYATPQNTRGSVTPTYVPATTTPADSMSAQGPDSGHLLGAAGLGLIGGIALAGVLAVFVFNSFVDESGQAVSDAKVVERLSPAQTTTSPIAVRSGLETRIEATTPPAQTAATATAEPPAPDPRPVDNASKPKLMANTAVGAPDTPIRLNIALMSSDVGDALVSLKGLPKEAKLSTGIDVGGGQWLLPPARLKDLTVTTPGNAAGSYQLEAQLLKDDAQTSISDAVPFTLNVGIAAAPKPAPAQPAPSAAPGSVKPDASRLALLPDEAPLPETDFLTQVLIRDGNKKMREGDIAGARRLYEQAWQSGNAEAALAMGRSYDPTYFEKLTVKTGKPDPANAFTWYKRALDGGLVTAKVKIDTLNQWLQK
jgi:hypothetical protein